MPRPLSRSAQRALEQARLQESIAMQALRSANRAIADAHEASKDQELVEILAASKAVLRRLVARNRQDKFLTDEERYDARLPHR